MNSTDVRSTAELAQVIRDARDTRRPLRIVARQRWSGAGSPAQRVAPDIASVCVAPLAGVVEYVPSDLTLTVRAGTTLAELDAATAVHNQWCPLLAWGDDAGSVGATFATATAGPCASALGRPRDIALGVEFVDGTGATIRGGGRVVKNVAGFDLTRLMVGAFGTLGVITEVTVRLRARPTVDRSFCILARADAEPGAPEPGAALAIALRRAEIMPIACEVLDTRVAGALSLPAGAVIVRYGGNRALVDAGRRCADAAGGLTEIDTDIWTRFRALDPHPRRSDTSPGAASVARRVKNRFDPEGILNTGLMEGLA